MVLTFSRFSLLNTRNSGYFCLGVSLPQKWSSRSYASLQERPLQFLFNALENTANPAASSPTVRSQYHLSVHRQVQFVICHRDTEPIICSGLHGNGIWVFQSTCGHIR